MNLTEGFPKTEKKILDFLLQDMIKKLKKETEIPEDFKEMVLSGGINQDEIHTLFKDFPRALFDIFDINNVVINIIPIETEGMSLQFTWSIQNFKGKVYDERIKAEKEALKQAVKILENIL